MRRSYGRFLLKYCQELTGLETSSLKQFFEAASEDSPRAFEPLLLLALEQDRTEYLMKQARGTAVESCYQGFLEGFLKCGVPLEDFLSKLPDSDRFKKVWLAWKSENTQGERDRVTLQNIRNEMEKLLAQKGMSKASACRALNLNKGNFYAFMKGDTSKLGRATAVAAYRTLASL